ncbi:hypothetical protein SAMN05446935_5957 [Burkholderia sp. YR290]|nr:hypothetical protein SAMN05446935_5957 [Burkholderia sp. YR290]
MPYVSQTQHVDRVRGAIEGRLPAPANSSRLVSSWQRSYEQYQLDPSSVIGPRVLTTSFPDYSPNLSNFQRGCFCILLQNM